MELTLRELTKAYRKTVALGWREPDVYAGDLWSTGAEWIRQEYADESDHGQYSPNIRGSALGGRIDRETRKILPGRIGYVPQQQALYPDFSVRMFLDYMAALKGIGACGGKGQPQTDSGTG